MVCLWRCNDHELYQGQDNDRIERKRHLRRSIGCGAIEAVDGKLSRYPRATHATYRGYLDLEF